MKTNVRWLHRIDRSFPLVSKQLVQKADEIFHSATCSAEKRAGEQAVAELHAEIAGMDVHREVLINIKNKNEIESTDPMIFELEWQSANAAYLFPTMQAKLYVSAFGEQTQLDFRGEYNPPFGVLGQTIDTMLGANVAEASVEHFVKEIGDRILAIIPSDRDPESVKT